MSSSVYALLQSVMADQAKKRPTADEIVDKLAELDLDVTKVPERPSSKRYHSTDRYRSQLITSGVDALGRKLEEESEPARSHRRSAQEYFRQHAPSATPIRAKSI